MQSPAERSRDITLEGTANFRDLGGYRSRHGGTVRWGLVYRSAELASLSDADLDRLAGLGIGLIYDLRSGLERSRRPNRGAEHWAARRSHRDYEHSGADLAGILADPATGIDRLREMMVDLYRRLPFEQGQAFREIFHAIAAGELPLLFHCAAGKDRTGVMAALLLDLLGVPRDVIRADFAMTDRYFERNRTRFLRYGQREGVDDAVWDPILRADPLYLDTMFAVLDAHAGGIAGYLAEIGVGVGEVEAIRHRLLEGRDHRDG